MSKSMLITRPDHEIVTKYCCIWSEDVIRFASQKFIDVYDLKGKKANRKEFESYVKSKNPSLIFFNGHGNTEVITGYDNKPLVDMQSVPSKSIIYARSCDAAQYLGPMLIQKGARSFIGYTRKFTFFYDPMSIMKPANDPMARLFLETSNLVVSAIIKDHTVAEADQRSRSAMFKNLQRMLSSEATFEERYAAPAMWSNINAQVVLGDLSAKI